MFPSDLSEVAAWRCEQCRRLILSDRPQLGPKQVPIMAIVLEPTATFTEVDIIRTEYEKRAIVVCEDCWRKLSQEGAI